MISKTPLNPKLEAWNPPRNCQEEMERELIEMLERHFPTHSDKRIHAEIALGELIGFYHGEIERREALLRSII